MKKERFKSNVMFRGIFAIFITLLFLGSCSQPFGDVAGSATGFTKYAGAGYPEWVDGVYNPSNGERYRYEGHVFQAQNNPGSWETPRIGSWFWDDLGTIEDDPVDTNSTNGTVIDDGNFTPILPANPNVIPDKVFAPYIDISKNGLPKISDILQTTGQKYYVLSFIIGDKEINAQGQLVPNGKPIWLRFSDDNSKQLYGTGYMDGKFANVTVMNEINAVRAAGGEVIISFGGAAGYEFASYTGYTTAAQIQAQYQTIIDTYKLTWMDMNIENEQSTHNMDLRMEALKNLQVANPGLKISFQLQTTHDLGLVDSALSIIDKAVAKGVDIYSVGLMTMNFGSGVAGQPLGPHSIAVAEKAREQLNAPNRDLRTTYIGLCPMIGQNDSPNNIFSLQCARDVAQYAKDTSWLNWVAMWSVYRDNGGCAGYPSALFNCSGVQQVNWEFSGIFKSVTGSGMVVPPSPTPTPPGGLDYWYEGASYGVNNQVYYQGSAYKCMVSHTAITGWEPTIAPTLWQIQ